MNIKKFCLCNLILRKHAHINEVEETIAFIVYIDILKAEKNKQYFAGSILC
jgi:hypothetical protein